MGLFNFVSGGLDRLLGGVDAKMTQTLEVGLETMRAHAHVRTGFMKSTIGGEYRRSDRTVMIHIDAPYALIEAARGGAHDFITPGTRAMGRAWNGNFEIHLPNTLERTPLAAARNKARIGKIYGAMGRAGRNTKIHSRRWHKRYPDSADHLIL